MLSRVAPTARRLPTSRWIRGAVCILCGRNDTRSDIDRALIVQAHFKRTKHEEPAGVNESGALRCNRLFVAQDDQRIDTGGAACRNVSSAQRHQDDKSCGAQDHAGIGAGDAIQQRF
jgi:hypothetical protein